MKAFWLFLGKFSAVFAAVSAIGGACYVAAAFIIQINTANQEGKVTAQKVDDTKTVVDSLLKVVKKNSTDISVLVKVVKDDIKDRKQFNRETIEKIEQLSSLQAYEKKN